MIMRSKINPNATIRSEQSLAKQMMADKTFMSRRRFNGKSDQIALYALSHGVDGWYSGSYTMMVNRGVLSTSKRVKRITSKKHGPDETPSRREMTNSWSSAADI